MLPNDQRVAFTFHKQSLEFYVVAISDSHCTGLLHAASLQGDGDKIKEAKRNTLLVLCPM